MLRGWKYLFPETYLEDWNSWLTRHHSPLKEAELAVLRKQYEGEGQFVGVQTKFNYAWGLIKSDKRAEQQLGVRLLTGIGS